MSFSIKQAQTQLKRLSFGREQAVSVVLRTFRPPYIKILIIWQRMFSGEPKTDSSNCVGMAQSTPIQWSVGNCESLRYYVCDLYL